MSPDDEQRGLALLQEATDAILVTNGSDDALDLVCRTYLEPGDDVVVVWPTYGHFLIYVKARGVQPRLALSDDPFAVQTSTILDTIRDDTASRSGTPRSPH